MRAQRKEEGTEGNYYHRGTEFAELRRNPKYWKSKTTSLGERVIARRMLPIDSTVSFREHFLANYELVLWG